MCYPSVQWNAQASVVESERMVISKSSCHLNMHAEIVYLCLPNEDENKREHKLYPAIYQYMI